MKKRFGVFVVVMALLLSAMSCAAYAQSDMGAGRKGNMKHDGMGNRMGMMGMMGGMGMMNGMHKGMMLKDPKMQKELGLNDAQKARLKKIFSDEERKSIKSEANLKTLHMDIKDLMEAPKSDRKKLDSKIDEIVAACAVMMKLKIHAMQDAMNVLTPDQRKKCMEMMKKMKMDDKDMKGMDK